MAVVTGEGPKGQLPQESWNAVEGFVINIGDARVQEYVGNYTCKLSLNETTDLIVLSYLPRQSPRKNHSAAE
jgi:hypothetical protein